MGGAWAGQHVHQFGDIAYFFQVLQEIDQLLGALLRKDAVCAIPELCESLIPVHRVGYGASEIYAYLAQVGN